MYQPQVSIILPTYNRELYIARSINSVLVQTYENFEVTIVDDASTDATYEVVKAFNDERIRYIRLPNNKGVATARNVGIQNSKGKYIAFQDSDDEWLPEKLEKHMLVFEKKIPDLAIAYSDMERIFKDGTKKYHQSPEILPGYIIDPQTQFYQPYKLGIQSTVIRKECFDEIGCFNENFLCFEDLELFIRLSNTYEFFHIKAPLVKYYETNGLCNNIDFEYNARKLLLRLYFRKLIKHNKKFIIKELFSIYKYYVRVSCKKVILKG